MGWNNPAMHWKELERRLSGLPGSRRRAGVAAQARLDRRPGRSSAPRRSRPTPSCTATATSASSTAPARPPSSSRRPCASACTRSRSPTTTASTPPRCWPRRRRPTTCPTVFGAELSLGLSGPQNGVPDPEGSHLLVLARGVEGYHRLAAAMTDAHLRGDEKGRPVYDLDELGERGRGHWAVLTGCRKGAVQQALATGGEPAAAEALDRLTSLFGLEHVLVELSPRPGADATNASLARLAAVHGLDVVAAGNVHHATPQQHRLASAMAAVRARRSLADLDGWLDLSGSAHLRSGAETAAALAAYPGAVARSVSLADELAFDLRKASPALPKRQIPEGHTADSWLRVLAERGFAERYAGVPHEREARERLEHELRVDRREGLRRLLRHRPRHRRLRPRARHPLPGPRLGGELRGLLRPRHHRGRRRLLPAALRALHLRPPRRGARHRRRLRLRPARGGHPVGLRHLRAPQRRPGRQRHHLPTADGRARRRQGPRLLPGAAGRLVQADRRLEVRGGRRPGRPGRPRRAPHRWWRSPRS